MCKVTKADAESDEGRRLGLREGDVWSTSEPTTREVAEAEWHGLQLYQAPTFEREAYLRAEIGLEYLEEIEYGHTSYRTNIEQAARDAILNFLSG